VEEKQGVTSAARFLILAFQNGIDDEVGLSAALDRQFLETPAGSGELR
jgi:hypothetical protein